MPTSSIAHCCALPASSSVSMKIQACGFVHSILVTVPVSSTGRLMSNSDENA